MSTDFAIITVLNEEYRALDQRFKPDPQRYPSGRTYGVCQVQADNGQYYTVAIGRCWEQGSNVAQHLAHDMINDLSPSLLLVVGIAGAVPNTDFTLGDVVISSRIHDFGLNAYKPGEIEWNIQGGIHPYVSEIIASLPMYHRLLSENWNTPASISVERPGIDRTKFKNFDLSQLSDEDKHNLLDSTSSLLWQKKILGGLREHFGNTTQRKPNPIYYLGSIASSSSLIRDSSVLIRWLSTARGIVAFEMEAAGVFQAAQQTLKQYPVITIRGISDIPGLVREDGWKRYACHSAAAFTYAFIKAGIVKPMVHTNNSNHTSRLNGISNTAPISSTHFAQNEDPSLTSSNINTSEIASYTSSRPEKGTERYPAQAFTDEKVSYAMYHSLAATIIPTSEAISKQYTLIGSLKSHTDWVSGVTFSHDGQYLASSSYDGTIKLWEVSTRSNIQTLKGHEKAVSDVAFSPNGHYLASSGDDSIKLWDIAAGKIIQTLQRHGDWVSSVVFSPNGHYLASGSDDQTIRLWEIPSGKLIDTFAGNGEIYSVAFSPNSELIAEGSLSKAINIWDISAKKVAFTLKEHERFASSVVFSPDGHYLVSGCDSGSIKLWEIANRKVVQTLTEHSGWIRCVVFSPDGRLFASGSDDQTIKIWEVSSGRIIQTLIRHTNKIESLAFSPDGLLIASGGRDKIITLWTIQ